MVSALPADIREAIDAARERLRGFDRVEHYAEVQSTNDLALARAAGGAFTSSVISPSVLIARSVKVRARACTSALGLPPGLPLRPGLKEVEDLATRSLLAVSN